MNQPVRSAVPILPASAALLAAQGQGGAHLTAFASDASPRRYFRLEGQGLILMEDPADPVGFTAYLRLSAHLNRLGLSAPRVIAAAQEQGVALIEDFCDGTYSNLLAQGQDETALYELAVDALLHLHHDIRAAQVDQPDYDPDVFLNELDLFTDWFAPAVLPDLKVAEFRSKWRLLWQAALAPLAGHRHTLVLRDFHVDNLMLIAGRNGIARCGVLDFQDALIGPCEYDLVSLLQDARRDLRAGLEGEMLKRYIASVPEFLGGGDAIRRRYHLLGAQRHARILGVFVRLCQRDAKPRYLQFLPRVLAQFQTALSAAKLTDIETLLDQTLGDWRSNAAKLHTRLKP
ncbi:MAG: phosphotransferase [Rhodobacteraceae bacterium]|nr:phosphotransferase [Paracoccaceae bacterium]